MLETMRRRWRRRRRRRRRRRLLFAGVPSDCLKQCYETMMEIDDGDGDDDDANNMLLTLCINK